jgi:hypothetical protein
VNVFSYDSELLPNLLEACLPFFLWNDDGDLIRRRFSEYGSTMLFRHGAHYVGGERKYSVFFTIDPFHQQDVLSLYYVVLNGFLLNTNEKVMPKREIQNIR